MEKLNGTFYLAGSSLSLEVEVDAYPDGRLLVVIQEDRFSYVKGEYDIQPRLGSTKRVVTFRDGARLEVMNDDAFERFETQLGNGGWLRIVDRLERHWFAAVSSLLIVALLSVSFIYWGVPALASIVASKVSQELRESISQQSLDTMQSWGELSKTELSPGEIERSQIIFARALEAAGLTESPFNYQLLNFKMGGVENAFALPSGGIVATDSFIRLCRSDAQMEAVFLHEMAHVEEQHGIRSIVQRTGVLVIASMVLGDVSAVANVAGALPVLLLESKYSQRFELDSDTYAAETLQRSGGDVEALKEILILLHKDIPDMPLGTFLSTHPSLRKRIENLDRIAADQH